MTVLGRPQPGPQSSPRPVLLRLARWALSRRPVGSGLGVQAALAAADTARPAAILPRGGAAPPNLAAGLLGAPWSGGVTGILKDTEQEPPGL